MSDYHVLITSETANSLEKTFGQRESQITIAGIELYIFLISLVISLSAQTYSLGSTTRTKTLAFTPHSFPFPYEHLARETSAADRRFLYNNNLNVLLSLGIGHTNYIKNK